MQAITPTLEEVKIEQLVLAEFNPRKTEGSIDDLQASIAVSGITNPLLVRSIDAGAKGVEKLQVLAGSRRLRAAIAAGFTEVPCLVYDGLSDADARELAITDNLQRVDVHPVEEAEAYRNLMGTLNESGGVITTPMTVDDVAKRVGKPAAYVAQRLKLLDLEIDAKLLFSREHLTLGHALLLARLTPVDQGRALEFMLDINRQFNKKTVAENIREDLARLKQDKGVDYRGRVNHKGGRLIETTEAQLKKWIESNVLLKLASVPWSLEDALLVTTAGPCTTCPKRSGSNASLFGDLTAAEDVCLDPACFGAKQNAVVAQHKAAAKEQGGKILKISTKSGHDRLDAKAVSDDGIIMTSKTLRDGQWVPAKGKSCPYTVAGVWVDGPDKGKLKSVCPNQSCKTHKHTVKTKGEGYGNVRETPEDAAREKAAAAARVAYVKDETPVRLAVYQAIRSITKVKTADVLRSLLLTMNTVHRKPLAVCQVLGLPVSMAGDSWDQQRRAEAVLGKWLGSAKESELHYAAFDFLHTSMLTVESHMANRKKEDRGPLWKMAAAAGIDADGVARGIEQGRKAPAPDASKAAVKASAPRAAGSTPKRSKAPQRAKTAKTAKKK